MAKASHDRTASTGRAEGAASAPSAEDVLRLAARALTATKAQDVVALDLREVSTVCDYFLIASGTSEQHLRALAREVSRALAGTNVRPWQREGEEARRWILLDFVDVVVHLFHHETRGYYRLESLWSDAKRVPLDPADPDRDPG